MDFDFNVKSLKDLDDAINDYKIVYPEKMFFRGECKWYERRIPGIMRDEGHYHHELDFYQDVCKLHKSELDDEQDYIDKLALMQHYGFPTRLIDMTVNPYVALYFACCNDSESAGYIYMYIENPVAKDNQSVRLLSWCACNEWNDYDDIVKGFKDEYSESLTEEQVRIYMRNPVFIKRWENCSGANDRLDAQNGTFVICGEIKNHLNQKQIVGLEKIKPTLTFVIQPEYKNKILKELNDKKINTATMFTDLQSMARFLRDKYKDDKANLEPNEYLEIKKEDDNSNRIRRSVSVKMILKRSLSIENIHEVVKKEILSKYTDKDVVWTYVALNQDDYLLCNFITQMLWINPKWGYKETYSPQRFEHDSKDGFSWSDNETLSLSEFAKDYLYINDDAYIYVSALYLFNRFTEVYDIVKDDMVNGDFKGMLTSAKNNIEIVQQLSYDLDDLGITHDERANECLDNITNLFCDYINLSIFTKGKKADDIKFWISKEDKYITSINQEMRDWKNRLKDTDDQLNRIKPLSKKKERESGFEQTIPMSENSLSVSIKILAEYKGGNIELRCETNLFDYAQLGVTIKRLDGKAYSQYICNSETIVMDGLMECLIPITWGSVYKGDTILADIVLLGPSQQDIRFKKKTGIQYENISGEFIKRDSFEPYGECKQRITVN